MLNNFEEKFIYEFLEDFPEADLFAVALNITKHNITPSNRHGKFSELFVIHCLHL